MQIIVNDKWLDTCGMVALSGVKLDVLNVRDFGTRGKFYKVETKIRDFVSTWEVWSHRGVQEFN